MNAIQFALNEVRHSIPPQVLKLVFDKRRLAGVQYFGNEPQLPTALIAEVRKQVIDARVMPMVNCIGATMVEIPLASIVPEMLDRFRYIYRIPKESSQGRSIVSVSSITFGTATMWGGNGITSPGGMYAQGCGTSAITGAQRQIAAAFAPIPIVQSPNVTLIGDNVVLVEDFTPVPTGFFLRCMVAHDENLTRINPVSYPDFAKMVIYAVKAFIYNNYYIELGAGELVGGMQLGQVKDVVDGYSDADELLKTFYDEKWGKVSFCNDDARYRRAVRLTLGALS